VSAGFVIAVVLSAFIVGGLARFALPGPDPMPAWLTIGVAIALVAAYRAFVQKRPIFGPGARKFPERGIGIEQYRERLRRAGFDPDSLQPDPKVVQQVRLKAAVDELHRAGILDDEELKTLQDRLEPPAA